MRVAIVGSGLSGMAAALALQAKGIWPDVFERMNGISDFPSRAEVVMNVYNKPIDNILGQIRTNYGLKLNYLAPLHRIIWHTRNASASAEGDFGVIDLRGNNRSSIDRQLAEQLTVPIKLGSNVKVTDLQEYDWIVDADGQSDPKLAGARTFSFLQGTIRGQFSPDTMHIWHTTQASPQGFAYLLPRSSSSADVFLVVPLREYSCQLFPRLWQLLKRDLGFEPELVEEHQFKKVLTNRTPEIKENVLPVGNKLGTAVPFLGAGQLFAISTSFSAAGKIAGSPDGYLRALRRLDGHLNTMRTVNQAMDSFGDFVYDSLVMMMKLGATPFFVSKRNCLATVAILLRPYCSILSKIKKTGPES